MDKNTLGIFCKKDKTFYYLETGEIHLKNQLPRIKKTLIQRSLIILDQDTQTDSESYDVVRYEDAIEKEYLIKPIYLNQHIKRIHESKNHDEDTGKWK